MLQVLGPLQDIIRGDFEWRLNAMVGRQMRKVRAKLTKATIADFHKLGLAAKRSPIGYIVADHTKVAKAPPRYTLKVIAKSVVNAKGLQIGGGPTLPGERNFRKSAVTGVLLSTPDPLQYSQPTLAQSHGAYTCPSLHRSCPRDDIGCARRTFPLHTRPHPPTFPLSRPCAC